MGFMGKHQYSTSEGWLRRGRGEMRASRFLKTRLSLFGRSLRIQKVARIPPHLPSPPLSFALMSRGKKIWRGDEDFLRKLGWWVWIAPV